MYAVSNADAVVAADPQARAGGVAKRAPRPVPSRVPALAHLDLEALRSYRRELTEEETLVSYWRRLMQARLDVLRSTSEDRSSVERLRRVLGGQQSQTRRTSLLSTLPLGDSVPLPDLRSLWESQAATPEAAAALVTRVTDAESQLSVYRNALHERLDLATRELIARYHADPPSCLSVLPLQP